MQVRVKKKHVGRRRGLEKRDPRKMNRGKFQDVQGLHFQTFRELLIQKKRKRSKVPQENLDSNHQSEKGTVKTASLASQLKWKNCTRLVFFAVSNVCSLIAISIYKF